MYVQLTPGQVFAERYRIVRCIGVGGMGAVFEAVHVHTKRPLAVKVMLPEMAANAEMRGRFQNEAQITAQIQCDFIAQVLDAGIDAPTGMPFMVMEFLQGQELAKVLEERGRLGPAETVTILAQVAVALRETHAARIVHRDLKPGNIFMTRATDGSPRVKLLDFGVSKLISEASNSRTRGMGTPAFMAPEQFRGLAVTPAADIYALAMVAYEMLTGVVYWQDECQSADFVALAMRLGFGPAEAASVRAARSGLELPRPFDAWFAQCTALEPTARFPSAIEAVSALAQALALPTPPLLARPADDALLLQPPLHPPLHPATSPGSTSRAGAAASKSQNDATGAGAASAGAIELSHPATGGQNYAIRPHAYTPAGLSPPNGGTVIQPASPLVGVAALPHDAAAERRGTPRSGPSRAIVAAMLGVVSLVVVGRLGMWVYASPAGHLPSTHEATEDRSTANDPRGASTAAFEPQADSEQAASPPPRALSLPGVTVSSAAAGAGPSSAVVAGTGPSVGAVAAPRRPQTAPLKPVRVTSSPPLSHSTTAVSTSLPEANPAAGSASSSPPRRLRPSPY